MFYLWKRYLSSPTWRLLLSPVYALGACATVYRLRLRRGPVWVAIFMVALVVTLVPTPLLEPRYFTPGVVVALLNAPNVSALPSSLNLIDGLLGGLVLTIDFLFCRWTCRAALSNSACCWWWRPWLR